MTKLKFDDIALLFLLLALFFGIGFLVGAYYMRAPESKHDNQSKCQCPCCVVDEE